MRAYESRPVLLRISFALLFATVILGCARIPRASSNADGVAVTAADSANLREHVGDSGGAHTIWYAERIHDFSGQSYVDCATQILSKIRGAQNDQVVLWPNRVGEKIEQFNVSAIQPGGGKEEEFGEAIHHRVGTPDRNGFIAGLNVCQRLAGKVHGSIVVIGDGTSGVDDAGLKRMMQISKELLLSAVVFREPDENPDAWKAAISGYLVTILPSNR